MNLKTVALIAVLLGAVRPALATTRLQSQDLAPDLTITNSLTVDGQVDGQTFTENGSPTLSNDISGNAATATNASLAALATLASSATALAADPTDCNPGEFFRGIDAFGNAQNCSAAGSGNVTSSVDTSITGNFSFTKPINGAAFPARGVNYVVEGGLLHSTGTSSFHVGTSTMVYHGVKYLVADTSFSMVNSSFSFVTWNPTNGHRKFGITNFEYSTISSFTAMIADDIVVAASSSGVTGTVSLFDTAWRLPGTGLSFSGRSGGATSGTKSKSAFNCSVQDYYSCNFNSMDQIEIGRSFRYFNDCTGAPCESVHAFTVYVDSPTASSIRCMQNSNSTKMAIIKNGGAETNLTNHPAIVTTSLSGNTYTFIVLRNTSSTVAGGEDATFSCVLDKFVRIVRGGTF